MTTGGLNRPDGSPCTKSALYHSLVVPERRRLSVELVGERARVATGAGVAAVYMRHPGARNPHGAAAAHPHLHEIHFIYSSISAADKIVGGSNQGSLTREAQCCNYSRTGVP